MSTAHFAELLQKWGLPFKLERATKMTTLWAGYGSVYHLVVKDGRSTRNLVVKDVQPPAGSGVSHERKLRSYQVEAAFYQRVAPQLLEAGLPIAHPAHVDNDLSGAGGAMHLLLTDLRDEYPATQRPMDLAHAKAALSWLARLHASFWQQPPAELWAQGCFWQLDTRQEELEAMEPEWRDLQAAAQAISDELANAKFQTCVHGDFKGANICFSAGGGTGLAAAAYDFQYCGGGDPMKDVAYLLCSTVEGRVVQRHEKELLEHYHAELTGRLPAAAAAEYTPEVMKERLGLAICDFVRFMAGWGWWGNTSWAAQKAREGLKKWTAAGKI